MRGDGELTARYPTDTVAHNNRATCYAGLRDYRRATDEGRQALQILPNHMTYRGNLALWAAYAGDFTAAERQVTSIAQPTADAMQPLPLSLLAQGRLQEAASAYRTMGTMGTFGAAFAASGLGDLAVYEGRFSEAAAIYARGAAADIKDDNADYAAQKLAALAHAQLSRGQKRAAVAAAKQALAASKAVSVKFPSARVLVEAGAAQAAQRIAASLAGGSPSSRSRTGRSSKGRSRVSSAICPRRSRFSRRRMRCSTPGVGHFELGRADPGRWRLCAG